MYTVLLQEPKKIVDEIGQFIEHNCYPDALDDEDKQSTENLEKLLILLEKSYDLASVDDKPTFEDLEKLLLDKCYNLALLEDKPIDNFEKVLKVLKDNQDHETLTNVLRKIYSSVDLFIQLDIIEESKNFRNNIERLIRRSVLKEANITNIECESEIYKQEYQATLQWLCANGNQEDLELIQKLKSNSPYSSEEILRSFDIAERDIINRLKKSFQLMGYSHPFDEYPAPIVPIGYYEDKLVAVYLDPSNPSDIFLDLDQDHQYIKFNDQLKQDFADFNYLEDKLFAFSPDVIAPYPVAEEKEFYKDVLRKKDLSYENPFLRYSLAKTTEDIEVIQQELIHCLKYLQSNSPLMIPSWYEIEKNEMSHLWEQNGTEFPTEDDLMALVNS